MASGVIPSGDFRFVAGAIDIADGLEVAVMAGAAQGSVHLEVALSRLGAGGVIRGHRHFYEESFYMLEGRALLTFAGRQVSLEPDDFGYIPAGMPHAWSNRDGSPATWFRMRSPQPREIAGGAGTFLSPDASPAESGVPVVEAGLHHLGRFEEHHLPAPGPISMKGYRGANVNSVSIWMLVDEYLGALHHTMFIVQFVPGASTHPEGDHFHPFEEAYYFLSGSAIAHLDGEDVPVTTGDLVFAGTNAQHGYTMTSEEPVRWIEVQAPAPTAREAFIFPSEWRDLSERSVPQ